jgi:hypothetical protein
MCCSIIFAWNYIYIQQKETKQAAYTYFALASINGCNLAEDAIKKWAVDAKQHFIDFHKDKQGGRRTHRKKRELRKRTLRKNRTKRRA